MSVWTSVAADTTETWVAPTAGATESYAAQTSSVESFAYIETIWDAGASVWDDDTSHWDGAYVNDWADVPDVTAEVWA